MGLILLLGIFAIGTTPVGAACHTKWHSYSGMCYILTNIETKNVEEAQEVCTNNYQYSELLADEDLQDILNILSLKNQDNKHGLYWITCTKERKAKQSCWASSNSSKCIEISNGGQIHLSPCSRGYVICRRPENILKLRFRKKRSPGSKSSKTKSRRSSRCSSSSSSANCGNDDDKVTTTTPASLSSEITPTSFYTFFHGTASIVTPGAVLSPVIPTATPTGTQRASEVTDVARTTESISNIIKWIESQESNPMVVLATCNDVVARMDKNASSDKIYELIEQCENYALRLGMNTKGDFGLFFNFEFLEVAINKSSDFFGGMFSYFSQEGNEINLNLTKYSTNEDKGNISSTVALLIFKNESAVNMLGKNKSTYLGSDLLAASFAVGGDKMSTGIDFNLNTEKKDPQNKEEYVCAFWRKDGDKMYWSTSGCNTEEESGQINCLCNHTTSYGVLIQATEIPEEHEEPLSYITYIGCAFSLTALFITITILICIPSLNSTRIKIHKHFVVALILAQIILLVGQFAENKEIICQCVTVAMHYLWLAVFFWMLMEGVHLYVMVVKVYNSGKSYLRYYVAIGWGCPIVIVIITASFWWKDYESERCWLSVKNDMIWAFIGPAAAIVLVNVLILIRVICVVVDSVDGVNSKPTKSNQSLAAAKGAIMLAPILGTTWIIGVFSNIHIIFTYAFTILNSIQGVFVFVFYCVRNSEVRNSIDRIREKRAINKSNEKNTSADMNMKSKTQTSNFSNKVGSIDNLAFQVK